MSEMSSQFTSVKELFKNLDFFSQYNLFQYTKRVKNLSPAKAVRKTDIPTKTLKVNITIYQPFLFLIISIN